MLLFPAVRIFTILLFANNIVFFEFISIISPKHETYVIHIYGMRIVCSIVLNVEVLAYKYKTMEIERNRITQYGRNVAEKKMSYHLFLCDIIFPLCMFAI